MSKLGFKEDDFALGVAPTRTCMASEKTNSGQATKYISPLDPFPACGAPRWRSRPTYSLGALTPLQIAVKPISQTRGQADANTE